ncbi:hypothetical protein PHLGIDRAFT_74148 [Phlebiopsis gigantea 11061_1 CR5-6]|uniref:Carboxylic ester hydrolase n=1 Tax=Phlebiopsis gigantea (strain 11061_1 CR5-6) TaxID=745531 RepID=A0A0C3RVU0_PHLG1|nr:hypothetical protein PHLGIDRAFT_74148 [Phlebiopsis gigantea 11061_1 CR5-6]
MRWLSLIGSLAVACSAAAGTVVDLGYAKFRGNLSYPNTVAFLGLQYAEPPVGDRRFRLPLPLNTSRVTAETKGAIIDASIAPQFCIQGGSASVPGGGGSEDCLQVNVYAPVNATKRDKLPVLVYIHGGGYNHGNPLVWPFDHWIHQVPDVVIVSVYYRLDSFGFLAHPDFATDPTLGDMNAGIQDQTEALRWVQKHIAAFGGDPDQVTIDGQSAGGSSIEIHLVAPQQQGLFHGAIAQSVYRTPLPTPEQQVPLFNFYAGKAGCGGLETIKETMGCLRNSSVSALAPAQDANRSSSSNGSYNFWRPVVDDKIIPKRPTPSILTGDIHPVRLMVGSCSNETLSTSPNMNASLSAFFPMLSPTDIAEYNGVYPLSAYANTSEQARVATGESELRCAAEIMADAWSPHVTTYVYRYNTANPTDASGLVEHAAESWMMFKGTHDGPNGTTTFIPMTPSQDAFAEELIAYWLSFVRAGNPNTFKLARAPTWPQYHPGAPRRVVLTEGTVVASGSTVETIARDEAGRCAFVASKFPAQQA